MGQFLDFYHEELLFWEIFLRHEISGRYVSFVLTPSYLLLCLVLLVVMLLLCWVHVFGYDFILLLLFMIIIFYYLLFFQIKQSMWMKQWTI